MTFTTSRIDAHFLIKISDFGLSEDVFLQNYFRQGAGGEVVKLPVKWMAPESLSDGHFSEKSDVVCEKRHTTVYLTSPEPSKTISNSNTIEILTTFPL